MFQKSSPKGAAFTFRCFSRKGFSLFAAVGKEVKIGVLTVATLSTAAPCLAAGEVVAVRTATEESEAITLDDERLLGEAVTTASRAPMAAHLVARPVMTISREQLAAAGVTSINDVLKLCAGIDVRQRGSFGLQTDISINGGSFDQLTILVNGIALNNPQTGHNAADFPLNLSDIDRIEVLEGAASRVLGTQAFSGAINVVTREGGEKALFRLSGGSHGTLEAEARGVWKRQWSERRFTTSLSSSYTRSDGAVRNSDFEGGRAFWFARYDDTQVRLDAQYGLTTHEFGAGTFYSPKFPNQWEATERHTLSLKAETKGRVHLAPQISWVRSTDHFQLIRGTHTAENFHRGDIFTLGLNAWTQWALGRTALGAEIREEGIYSTNLGLPIDAANYVRIAGKTPIAQADGTFTDKDGGAAYYTRRANRTNLNYFLEHNFVVGNWSLSLGALAQRNTTIDHRFRFYPGIDLSYRPAPAWRLYASWNRALRLPTFTDLYYKSPTDQGDPLLRPEENSSYRIGAAFRPSVGLHVEAKAFYNRGRNMIDWVKYTATDLYHSANHLQLNNYGLGFIAEFNGEALFGAQQPLRRLRLDYAWQTQSTDGNRTIYKSKYALEYLRHKFVATLDHRIISRLAASWTLRLQHRNGHYEVFDLSTNTSTSALAPYGTHARLDAKLHWTTPRYSLYLDLHNLTSHRHFDIANVELPGFFFMLGGSYRF